MTAGAGSGTPSPEAASGPLQYHDGPVQERPTVLVVEDDPDLRRTLVNWLEESRNLVVFPAADGEEARTWIERDDERIDVALIDLVLPDAFGSQIAFDQVLFHPDVRTIFMSGHLPDDSVLAASVKDLSATFLEKPFTLQELGQAIDRALSEGSGR